MPTSQPSQRREDPVLIDARREALAVLALWAIAFAWTIGYCAMFGYGQSGPPSLVWGVPSWVMWGIFVPWTACTLISTLLATWFIRGADLGEDAEESELSTKRSEQEAAREIGDG